MKKLSINTDIAEYSSDIYNLRRFMKDSVDEPEDIELQINSYGGDAFLGAAIHNELKSYPGKVTAVITGIAASAASAIAMGADEINIHSNAMLMLHNPWTIAMGNSEELRKAADDLEKVQAAMTQNYTERVELSILEPILAGETYLTAAESLELGLVDNIIEKRAETVESQLFAAKAEAFNAQMVVAQPETVSKPAADASPSGISDEDITRIAASLAATMAKAPVAEVPKPEPKKTSNLLNLFTK